VGRGFLLGLPFEVSRDISTFCRTAYGFSFFFSANEKFKNIDAALMKMPTNICLYYIYESY
jgi:hypothetical protein